MDRVLNLIGLAVRARMAVSGGFAVEKAVKEQTAKLVIVSCDASDNTKKLFRDKCSYYGIPCVTYSDKESLGHAVGAGERTSAAILDSGFAKAISEKIE